MITTDQEVLDQVLGRMSDAEWDTLMTTGIELVTEAIDGHLYRIEELLPGDTTPQFLVTRLGAMSFKQWRVTT